MQCNQPEYHGEHYYSDDENDDIWCIGNYEVVETFGVWRIILDPQNPMKGYIDTDPQSGLAPYYVDSRRVHEGENGSGYSWRDHMADKIWAEPYLDDFVAALNAARERWPRRKT